MYWVGIPKKYAESGIIDSGNATFTIASKGFGVLKNGPRNKHCMINLWQ